jgi:hypothetical protein
MSIALDVALIYWGHVLNLLSLSITSSLDEWMDGWMDGWMDESIIVKSHSR